MLTSGLRQTGPLSQRRTRVRVSLVLVKNQRLFLLKSIVQGEERWFLPGGGVEWGESLAVAARREAHEELMVDVEIGDLVAVVDMTSPDGDYHSVEIAFRVESEQEPIARPEGSYERDSIEDRFSVDGQWFAPDQLATLDAYPKRLVRQFLAQYIRVGTSFVPTYLENDW